MKKLILMACCLFSGHVFAHDFLTEILVYSDDYDTNPYHVAVSYDLVEQDILMVSQLRQTRSEMSKLVSKSHIRELNRSQGQDDFSSHDYNSESKIGRKTHGVFDHATESRLVAIDLCDAFAVSNYMTYPNGLVPQFTGPDTFTDGVSASQNHHELYQYADGLQFNCVEVIDHKLSTKD